jgi:arabinogalactan oligomer/maltooligosaccharide transport system substrate-binding protein
LRLPALLLALLLTISAASGTVVAQDEELSGSLLLWHGWTGAEADTLNNEVLPAWQAAYPNVSIETLAVPFDQLKNKYQTESASGGGPDLLIGPADWVGELVTADLIQPYDNLIDPAVLDNYLPATLDALRWDGQLYGMPESFEAVAMFYNKALVPEPPANTADLAAVAGQVTADNPDVYGLAMTSDFYHPAGYLLGFGASLFDDANMSALNSPETVNFLNWLKTLSEQPGVYEQPDDGAISSLFKEGKAAITFNGPWYIGDFAAAIGEENLGVAPMPVISENGDAAAAPFLGVKHLMINSNASEEQAALAATFATWFSGPDSASLLAAGAGHLPANTTVDVSDNPIAAGFVAQAESATPMPTIPEMGQVWTPAQNMITAVLSGDSTPEDAAAQAADEINGAIEQMGA